MVSYEGMVVAISLLSQEGVKGQQQSANIPKNGG